ncbi:MAG: Maf family protein [Caulobacteraceae bacterium]|nr:Maf family protein [Caulobacteraceae bacterium]
MTRIVLASRSAARAELLRAAAIPFETADSGVDEEVIKDRLLRDGASPRQIASALGEAKAVAVSARESGLVIGVDQTLDLAGALFDKAANLDEARDRLLSLRGRTHQLHAGLTVAEDGAVAWRLSQSASLTMRNFSEAFLDDYLAQWGPAVLSSVGCYHLESAGVQLFERIEGDYFTILGLPLLPLLDFLRDRGAIAQ